MDVTKLKEHEDSVKGALDAMCKLDQLIAFNYLRAIYQKESYQLSYEIEKECRKEGA